MVHESSFWYRMVQKGKIMRRGQKPTLIYDTNRPHPRANTFKPEENKGLFLGVCLSADYCAEHEWGIKPLQTMFGIPQDDQVFGLKRRQITQVSSNLRWVEFKSK